MGDSEEDLSGGDLPSHETRKIDGDLEEESQRRKWKTFILWAISSLAGVFIAVYLIFTLSLLGRFTTGVNAEHVYLLIVLAVIPSTLIVSLVKMVSKAPDSESYDFHPLVTLLKELIDALKK